MDCHTLKRLNPQQRRRAERNHCVESSAFNEPSTMHSAASDPRSDNCPRFAGLVRGTPVQLVGMRILRMATEVDRVRARPDRGVVTLILRLTQIEHA
eukprot:4581585-Pleurochrysis_carterae.AAC.2